MRMADPNDDLPTPEQLEARLSDVARLHELGLALRELRFLDGPARRPPSVESDRASDVGSGSDPAPDSRSDAHPST